MGFNDSFLLRDMDKMLSIAGAIFSIFLIILGGVFGKFLYLLVGVLFFISCSLWLAIRRSHTFEFHFRESRTKTTLWAICFFGLYTLSVLSVFFRPNLYERPLLYFILTALLAGIIACEIFTSGRRHAGLILIQIMLLGVSIAWSQLLIFPSVLGVDPWFHFHFTNEILDKGYIPEGTVYSKLPLFHLMVAVTSLVTDLPYKFAAMVSVSLGQIICNGVFVFLIANRLFKNSRVGLLAALMVIIANQHIFMSYSSIPNGFAAVFIPIALYLLIFRFKGSSRSTSIILNIILLATIILTHTITALCMAMLLFVAWGALTFYRVYHSRVDNPVSLLVPIGFISAMFAWWTYASGSVDIFGNLIKLGFTVDNFSTTPEGFRNYVASIPLGESLFNNLGTFLFFAFSFIGIFYMISRKESGLTSALAWVGMTPLAVGFFSIISGHTVIEDRWWYFAQILLSIPLAVAIYTFGTWKIKKTNSLYGFVFGFLVVLSFLMIMSPPANVDNLSFSPNSSMRYSFTDAELQSITTLTDIWDGPIKTDEYYVESQRFQYPQVSAFNENIYSNDFLALNNQKILIREVTIDKPFKIFSDINSLDYDLNEKLDGLGFSRIYDSNSVSCYQW